MSCIKNVTLADYAKEEVTFRVELHDATRVEDFVKDLSNAGSVTLEVTAVSPGELELHIAWTGS
jgi:uncharacterized protein YpmS